MRTLIFALTVMLLAAPVWATVTITATKDGDVVTIGYVSTETQLIRAFALDLTATGGNIIGIGGYTPGDNKSNYGIFPGSFDDTITVDPESGLVADWEATGYSPVAPGDDLDALGDIPGPGITIEMGSLYPEDGNAPSATEGTLCTITVEGTVTEVCVTPNATRGNVVLEDSNEPVELIVGCTPPDGDGCYPPGDEVRLARWTFLGEPDCWCPEGTGIASDGQPSRGLQCYGDTDNKMQFSYYEVYTDDLATFAADWKKLCTDAELADPCSDLDHLCQFAYYAVYTDDLTRLVMGWKKIEGQLTHDCPEIMF